MDRNRNVLAWAFMGIGAAMGFGALLSLFRTLTQLDSDFLPALILDLIISALFVLSAYSGYGLLNRKNWAYSALFKLSFGWLFIFPIGTILGLYYFWFNHKYAKNVSS